MDYFTFTQVKCLKKMILLTMAIEASLEQRCINLHETENQFLME